MSIKVPTRILCCAILVGTLALYGCASASRQDAILENATPCCTNFKELFYESLIVGERRTVTLSENSKVFVFDGRKSYFVAFSLPSHSGNTRRLHFQVAISGSAIPGNSDTLCPIATFLDRDYAVLDFAFVNPQVVSPGLLRDSVFVGMTDVPQKASFVVIHSISGGTTAYVGPQSGSYTYSTPSGPVFVAGRVTGGKTIPCAPTGTALLLLG